MLARLVTIAAFMVLASSGAKALTTQTFATATDDHYADQIYSFSYSDSLFHIDWTVQFPIHLPYSNFGNDVADQVLWASRLNGPDFRFDLSDNLQVTQFFYANYSFDHQRFEDLLVDIVQGDLSDVGSKRVEVKTRIFGGSITLGEVIEQTCETVVDIACASIHTETTEFTDLSGNGNGFLRVTTFFF